MSPGIGLIIELVRPYGIRYRLGVSLGLVVVVFGVLVSHCRYRANIGAQHAKKVNLFLTLRVWHVDNASV